MRWLRGARLLKGLRGSKTDSQWGGDELAGWSARLFRVKALAPGPRKLSTPSIDGMQPEKVVAPMNGSADHKTNGKANGNKNASSHSPRAPKNQKASDIKAKMAKELVVQTGIHVGSPRTVIPCPQFSDK